MTDTQDKVLSDDERRLHELGYKQELARSWSGFANFAVSFTIISVLAGCFTTFYQAWNNGGPVAVTWGWLIIGGLILIVSFCMAEIVSAYPTAGGIYWWASKLGGPQWGWFTGWFNLVGLIAVVASVDYVLAVFISTTYGLFDSGWTYSLQNIFLIYLGLLVIHSLINIFSSHLVSIINSISVWWHIVGVVIVIGVLIFVPDHHQSFSYAFTQTYNNSGFSDSLLWIYVLPLGFLLTQYTITGFDASAHISEETVGAARTAARGVWQSVFYSWVIGFVLLLSFVLAVHHPDVINSTDPAVNPYGIGQITAIFFDSLPLWAFKLVMIIACGGQLFCGMACLTSASRMTYAFSRDGAVPGSRWLSTLNKNRTPANAVIAVAVTAAILAIPALKGNAIGVPVAFLAIVSISVIGLYVAYVIPIYLRWRIGDKFESGPWTLGAKYKWMAPIAVLEVIIVTIYFLAPFSPAGIPGNSAWAGWGSGAVNYAPIIFAVVIGGAWIWWAVSAKHWFKGPKQTYAELDLPDTGISEAP